MKSTVIFLIFCVAFVQCARIKRQFFGQPEGFENTFLFPNQNGFQQFPGQNGFNQFPPQNGFNQFPGNQQPPQQGFNRQPPQQGFNQQQPQQGFNQQQPQQGFNQQQPTQTTRATTVSPQVQRNLITLKFDPTKISLLLF